MHRAYHFGVGQHRIHEMQAIATDYRGLRPSVCLLRGFTGLWCAKTAERIKVLFGVQTLGGSRNIVFDGGHESPTARGGGSAFDAAFVKLLWPLAIMH